MFIHELTVDALKSAFSIVKRNHGSGGVDQISIKQYERHLDRNLLELLRRIKNRAYEPLPVRRVHIPKPNGKTRPLGIPAVRDRVVQQAVLSVVQPHLEPLFSAKSYGFRPGKSARQAIVQIQEYLNQGYTHIVDADIRDFFGTLNQQLLMANIRDAIPDRGVTYLIWQFLRAGVMEEGKLRTATAGTPQGGVISPILANLYLNEFDHALEKAGLKLVRYADDFV
ncbi:MAG: reverse transcriptase domain-containing protein, partial [Bacteroidota bacterium]